MIGLVSELAGWVADDLRRAPRTPVGMWLRRVVIIALVLVVAYGWYGWHHDWGAYPDDDAATEQER